MENAAMGFSPATLSSVVGVHPSDGPEFYHVVDTQMDARFCPLWDETSQSRPSAAGDSALIGFGRQPQKRVNLLDALITAAKASPGKKIDSFTHRTTFALFCSTKSQKWKKTFPDHFQWAQYKIVLQFARIERLALCQSRIKDGATNPALLAYESAMQKMLLAAVSTVCRADDFYVGYETRLGHAIGATIKSLSDAVIKLRIPALVKHLKLQAGAVNHIGHKERKQCKTLLVLLSVIPDNDEAITNARSVLTALLARS